jgi:serine protease Do
MKAKNILMITLIFGLTACAEYHVNNPRVTPVVEVVREYGPAVVNIRTETVLDLKQTPEWGEYGDEFDRFMEEYFGEAYSGGTLKYRSIGSGVILNRNGLIATNAHVVDKARTIFVVLDDATILQAEVLATSRGDDLAMLKINPPHPVKEIKLANFDDVMIGETVIAIGDPLGLKNSVTVGVISGKDRTFSSRLCQYSCSGLLQTDAPINPGNSGGALFNLDGDLVGINLAVVQNAQSVGFAIPAYKIEQLLKELK